MKFNFVIIKINTDGNKFVAENISHLIYLFISLLRLKGWLFLIKLAFCQSYPLEFVKDGRYHLTINHFPWCQFDYIMKAWLKLFSCLRIYRGALWILGEYCSTKEDIQSVMTEVRRSLGEVCLLYLASSLWFYLLLCSVFSKKKIFFKRSGKMQQGFEHLWYVMACAQEI